LTEPQEVAEARRTTALHENALATARGTGFLAGGTFFEFAIRFLVAILLARSLGAGDYGLYVLSISAASLFVGMSLLGLDDAMVRYVAIQAGRDDRPGLRGTVQIGLGVSIAIGTVMGIVLFVAARPLAEGLFDEPRLTPLLRLFAFVIPVLAVSNVLVGATKGYRKMGDVALAENIIQSLIRLALLALLALMGELDLFKAAIVFGVSDVAASVALIVLLNRHFPLREGIRAESRREIRAIFRFAIPLWISGLLRQFRRNIQIVLLGSMRQASSVGVFAAAGRINLVGRVTGQSITQAVKPLAAHLHDSQDRDALAHLYATTTRWSLGLNIPFFLAMLLYPEALLHVFGEAFVAASTILVVLAFAELVNAGTGVCGPVLDMTGHTRAKLANTVLTTVLLIGTNALLIPRFGALGAAFAWLVAVATVNIVTVVEVWVLEKILPYDRSLWKPIVAGAGALAIGLLLRELMPVGVHLGPAVLQGAIVSLTYLGLLLLFGLAPEDRAVIDRMTAGARSMLRLGRRRERAEGRATS
jgi:O-antigen/teichoic acid export membrane protein